jgi:hypothetical protein
MIDIEIEMIEIEIDFKILQRNVLVPLQESIRISCKREIEIEIDKELARPFL